MILTSCQIKAADSLFMSENNVTERQLVERTAQAVFDLLYKSVDRLTERKILLLCGGGLNGADGMALALLLAKSGAGARIFITSDVLCDTADALASDCKAAGIAADGITGEYDIIIDAVFGIGFHGELPQEISKLFEKINSMNGLKIALDVPSGVTADNAAAAENAFNAAATVAICAKKPCHVFYPAKALCGTVAVCDIKLGSSVMSCTDAYIFELEKSDINRLLRKRDPSGFKGTFGKAGLVVGSRRYRGAAVMATKAALKSGAGIVCAYIPEDIYPAFCSDCMSAVVMPLKSKNGGIDEKDIVSKLEGCSAVLCGSGLGLTDGAGRAVTQIAKSQLPAVFDGDALTLISENTELLRRTAPTVITPHMGEFARLCNKTVDEIRAQRITLALKFVKDYGLTLVLKDSVTVIALPDGRVFVMSNPTTALAKGGSGDVLAGMICSFLAQHYLPQDAALIAVALHNACGHEAESRLGAYAALPEDITDSIKYILK